MCQALSLLREDRVHVHSDDVRKAEGWGRYAEPWDSMNLESAGDEGNRLL